jgi:hypothetical protein
MSKLKLQEKNGSVKTDVMTFERVCRESGMEPVKKVKVGDRIVCIADGWTGDHPDFRGPHYRTLWAVGKDENSLEVARPLYFAGGIGTAAPRETRIAAALHDGVAFAEEMNSHGKRKNH